MLRTTARKGLPCPLLVPRPLRVYDIYHPLWSRAQIGSTVTLMAERLVSRGYPSLELKVKIFPDEDHLTVMPIAYTRGVRYLWSE